MAIIGCGAVSRMFHIPILAGHPDVALDVLVDCNLDTASELSRSYHVDSFTSDSLQLDPKMIDAALVATPACFHASLSIELLRQGIHVFVEKPFTSTSQQTQEVGA